MVTDKKSIVSFRDGDTFVICLKGYTGIEEKKLLAAFLKSVSAQTIEDGTAEPVDDDDNTEAIAKKAKEAGEAIVKKTKASEEVIAPAPLINDDPAQDGASAPPAEQKSEVKAKSELEKKAAEKEEKTAAKAEKKAGSGEKAPADEKKGQSGEKTEKTASRAGEKKDDERDTLLSSTIESGPYKGKTFRQVFQEGFKSGSDTFLKDLLEVTVREELKSAKSRVFAEYVQKRFSKFDKKTIGTMSADTCDAFFDTYTCLCGPKVLSKIANDEGFKDFDEFRANADEEQRRTVVGVFVVLFEKPKK